MKKIIPIAAIVLVLVAVVCGCSLRKSPAKQILGAWEGENEIGSLVFKEDGIVTVGIVGLSTDGRYVMDADAGTLSITYTALGISYTKEYSFVIDGDALTLTGKGSILNQTFAYTRVGSD